MLTPFFDSGIQLALALQQIGEWLFPIMTYFTYLGYEETFILLLALVWTFDYSLAMRMGVMLTINTSLNVFFKAVFKSPRPFWLDPRVRSFGRAEVNFGLPSGHAQIPAGVYGVLAAHVKRPWVTWLLGGVIFLIGFSRVALGMHFYLDVVVGFIFGLILLWLFVKYEAQVMNWLNRMSLGGRIGTVFLVSLAFAAASLGVQAANADYQVPAQWAENALAAFPESPLDPFNPEYMLTSTGTLFGLAAGGFWLVQGKGYRIGSGFGKKILIFVIGLVGLLAIRGGLDAVFPDTPNLTGYAFRYLRYTIIGMWVGGFAPWLLAKIKLAEMN
jgi:membrane-associated phospholipid phosphatase